MKKGVKYLLRTLIVLFVTANIMAFFHVRKFTHFDPGVHRRTDPSRVPLLQKMGILFTGLSLPRPVNKRIPALPYKTITLQSNVKISCWASSQRNCDPMPWLRR